MAQPEITWEYAVAFDDLLEGQPKQVKFGVHIIALCKVGDEVFAVSDICTHEYAFLSDGFQEGTAIECPLHQAQFDVRTGESLCAPASKGVACFPVRIRSGGIYVGVPK